MPIKIKRQEIYPGDYKFVDLKIARLPSGIDIHMGVHIIRSKHPGPVLLLSGGLHGDEVNGIEIVRRLTDKIRNSELMCGTIISIPIINVFGFLNYSREVPDGKDVNRSFPGNKDGSLASLVAYHLSTYILPHIDYGIDYHTGGAKRLNYPQIRYFADDSKALELSKAFGSKYILGNQTIPGSLRWQAAEINKSIIVYEGGESLRLEEDVIEAGIQGTENLMKHLKMTKGKVKKTDTIICHKSSWIRAPRSGIYKPEKVSGDYIQENEIIATIADPFGKYQYPVVSKIAGHIIGHNNIPVVHKGDALFHILIA